jgi:hypothetical protein
MWHCRGQLKYHTVGKVITFHIVVDITHCRGQLKYHTVGTVRTLQMWYFIFPRQRGMFLLFLQCGILTVLAVWYIICPRQYGMFLMSQQCDILTVPKNVVPHSRDS